MKLNRASGIVLHPTSLPGPDGIGDIGPEAYRWVDFLAAAGCQLWQVLPLGPTGYGDSPYQCFSAFAGNPYLISPVLLMEEGLLTRADLVDRPVFPDDKVDFGNVINWKIKVLDRAFANFERNASKVLKSDYLAFQQEKAAWLQDFALFMAIKEISGGGAWNTWELPLRIRDPKALDNFRNSHAKTLQRHTLRQFLFFHQWNALHTYAHQKGLRIIGDVPTFAAFDSADAWSHPELFYIDEAGQPTLVAGVPPDYFSKTGQLWGNPLYRWEVHKASGYAWWFDRLRSALSLFDLIRLDHFRGFYNYWEIPAGMTTAEIGHWVPGPGADFFIALAKKLGDLPIIAEDLGEISPEVFVLRDQFGLPGMKILQFAFSSTPADPFLPHNYSTHCVAYTGTHDNDTSQGWYQASSEKEKDYCRKYLSSSGDNIAWHMIRSIWASVAAFSLAPMQDFLELDTHARMNFPGTPSGNWDWRMVPGATNPDLLKRIRELNYLFARLAE